LATLLGPFAWSVLMVALLVAVLAVRPAGPLAAAPVVATGEPVPLVVLNRPIVSLRARVDELTPHVRVERAAERIALLDHGDLESPVTAIAGTLGELEGYWIQVGDQTLVGLLPQDVDPEAGETLPEVAAAAAQRLGEALQAKAAQQRLPVLLRGFGLALAASIVLALILWGIERLRRWALSRVQALSHGRKIAMHGVDVRPYLAVGAGSGIRALVVGTGLLAGYLWLGFVLLQFPYSQPWGEQLGLWVRDLVAELGGGALRAVPGLVTVAIIFVVTRVVVQLVDRFFRSVEAGWLRFDWIEAETAKATRRLVVVLIWVAALVVAYPYIPGSQTAAFQGISVLLGLMVSLGSAGFVNQVMSGLVVAYSRSVRTGEFVQVGQTQGTVTEVGVLATKIVTPTRQEITIPNAVMVGSPLTNFSRHADPARGSLIATSLTIGYDTPWRQVEALLIEAARRTATIRADPPPRVMQRALQDFYVEYLLIFSLDKPETQVAVLSELHAQIQDVFNEHGVQIMSPHFMAQPAAPVVVPPEAWYTPPAVRPDAGDEGVQTRGQSAAVPSAQGARGAGGGAVTVS
jgi:small-conductance mechanosensitive channel